MMSTVHAFNSLLMSVQLRVVSAVVCLLCSMNNISLTSFFIPLRLEDWDYVDCRWAS